MNPNFRNLKHQSFHKYQIKNDNLKIQYSHNQIVIKYIHYLRSKINNLNKFPNSTRLFYLNITGKSREEARKLVIMNVILQNLYSKSKNQ